MDKKIIDALPEWADLSVECDGKREVIECDPSLCYPAYLDELHAIDKTIVANAYGVELARRCATQDLKELCGAGITLRWVSTHVFDEDGNRTGQKTGDAWALRNLPTREGSTVELDESHGIAHGPEMYKRLVEARKAAQH